jgi:hypothetical protein
MPVVDANTDDVTYINVKDDIQVEVSAEPNQVPPIILPSRGRGSRG